MAQHRQIGRARQGIDRLAGRFLQQAGDHHRSARRQFDRILAAPHRQARQGHRRRGAGADGQAALRRQFGHLDLDLKRNAPFGQDDRAEAETDAERLVGDGDLAVLIASRRNRKLAARQEAGGLAVDRGQVRLGQGADQTDPLEGLDRRRALVQILRAGLRAVQGGVARDAAGDPAQQSAVHAKGRRVAEQEARVAQASDDGLGVEPQLLDGAALHLDHADPQGHLIGAGDADQVHDLAAPRDEGARDLGGAVGFGRTGGRAGQDDAVVDGFGAHVHARRHAAERVLKRAGPGVHADPQGQNGATRGVQEDSVRLAPRQTDDGDAARRMQHGLGDPRIGHDHVARIRRKVDRKGGPARQVDHPRRRGGDLGLGVRQRRRGGAAQPQQRGAGHGDQSVHGWFPHRTTTASAWPSR
ncbi:hypothetical protein D3C87_1267200 [compost metagenome]